VLNVYREHIVLNDVLTSQLEVMLHHLTFQAQGSSSLAGATKLLMILSVRIKYESDGDILGKVKGSSRHHGLSSAKPLLGLSHTRKTGRGTSYSFY
jgi:hypothetical protein